MGKLLIRNLDDAVIAKLRQRAAANGNSMEEEARQALAKAVGFDLSAWLADIDAFRQGLPVMPANYSSLDSLHEGRAMHMKKYEAE
jgi:plasmid stability protein